MRPGKCFSSVNKILNAYTLNFVFPLGLKQGSDNMNCTCLNKHSNLCVEKSIKILLVGLRTQQHFFFSHFLEIFCQGFFCSYHTISNKIIV